MNDYSGLLARLDAIASRPVHVPDEISVMHDACAEAAAAIRALVANRCMLLAAVAEEREACAKVCERERNYVEECLSEEDRQAALSSDSEIFAAAWRMGSLDALRRLSITIRARGAK